MAHTVSLTIGGVAQESRTIEGVSIRYGRQSVQDQPDPTTLSLRMLRDSTLGTVNVDDVAVGAELELFVTPSGQSARRRFFGIISDVTVDQYFIQVAATAAGLNSVKQLRTIIGPGAYVYTYDSASLAIAVYLTLLSDSGVVDLNNKPLLFPDIYVSPDWPTNYPTAWGGSQGGEELNSWQVFTNIVNGMPSATFYENMLDPLGNGNVTVVLDNGYPRRYPLTPGITLADDEILLDWTATRDLGLYCTSATVEYTGALVVVGNEVTEPNLGVVEYNTDVANTRGPYTKDVRTQLQDQADAAKVAKNLTDIGTNPGYVADVTVPLATLTGARQAAIVDAMYCGTTWATPVLATGLPDLWYLEGYGETISQNDWTATLRLSDISNSYIGQPWNQVTASLQWGQVDATTTWLDLQGENI